MKSILAGWHLWRVVRLGAGLYIAGFAALNHEWAIAGIGTAYAIMAVLNIGCANGACAVPSNVQNNKPLSSEQEVIFEEIKTK